MGDKRKSEETFVLIACSKKKLSYAAPAQNIYTGQLFRFARQYADLRHYPILILSAKHHVLDPGEVIFPYDMTLIGMSKESRRQWAQTCFRDLSSNVFRERGWPDRLIILAGRTYTEFLLPMLHQTGRIKSIETPLSGLGIGQQLGKLKDLVDKKNQ